MGRYLVTGGGGFIGSKIASRLVERGDQVVVTDNLSTGAEGNVPHGVELVGLDISQAEHFNRIPTGHYDGVLHLAAQSSGEISHDNPGYDLSTNALGTLLLLDWCSKNDVPRFMYASSMAVYGLTEESPVTEDQRLDPISFYGITKQAAEHYVRYYSKHGLNTTVFRMFNVYGPGQNLENMKQGMVSIYLAFMLREEPILVKGSMERYRDFIYIDDVVSAWVTALDDPASYGKTYNLASGKKTLVKELLSGVIEAFGHDPETYPVEQGDGTPGDQFGIYADISRLTKELDWRPKVQVSEGLRRMADWAKGISAGHSG